MTRHLLLPTTARKRGSNGGGDPVDPTDPGETVWTPPTVADQRVMSLRPSLPPTDTYTISATGLMPDGSAADFTTFTAAYQIVGTAPGRALHMAITGRTVIDPTCRIDFYVAPGTYDQEGSGTPGPPTYTAYYALDPTPHSTVLRWGQENGGPFYWEGIDIVNVDNNGAFDPKYPLHGHAGGTTILTRCTLDNQAPQAGGYPIAIGMDGGINATFVMHDVTLASGEWTNIHGWPNWPAGPGQTTIFSNVRSPQASAYYYAMQDVSQDHLWVTGSTFGGVGMRGAATSLHVTPDTTIGNLTSYTGHAPNTTGATMTGVTDMAANPADVPYPTGGLSAWERQHYGITA
ncbi:hypothetical protein IEE94_11270 [Yimella sp. cx-573]|nr:hypothetical protein [Yimella sp. cx-573]